MTYRQGLLWDVLMVAVIGMLLVCILMIGGCGDEGPPKEIEVNGRTCISTVSDLECDFSK
jgi:hypothetical protein